MESKSLMVMQEELKKGHAICQVTVAKTEGTTPRMAGTMMVVKKDGTISGTVGGGSVEYEAIKHAQELIAQNRCELKEYEIKTDKGMVSGKVCLFFKIFKPREQLLIFGAGHVGYQLYLLAEMLHFTIVMLDDRDGFLSEERYPHAKIMAGAFTESMEKISFHEDTYVVVASSSHKSDEELLYALVNKPHAYLGMLGSQKKAERIKSNLLKRGIKASQLDALYAPIGIPLGGRQPEEVGLSILAQIVKVRNEKL
ncbi:XdhC family protein [Clostridia bacterium]|nr:XdhC family protein [Clostridia bacterium]